MKKPRALFFVLVLLASPASAVELPGDTVVLMRSTQTAEGSSELLSITKEQADPVPSWNPESGDPAPFSLKLAINLARDSVRSRHSRFDDFTLWTIEMMNLGPKHRDQWAYLIKFQAVMDGHDLFGSGYSALILMDGTIIEPTSMKSAE